MSSDPEQDEDDRDDALLRQLALARRRDDGALREQLLLADLLGRHRRNITRIVRYRAHSLRPSDADVDEMVGGVLRRLAEALERKLDYGKPFRFVAADNIEWEVIDFARRRKRRAEHEISAETMELAEPAALDGPTLEAEARELRAYLVSASDRERALLADQMLFGFDAEQTGARHDMKRGAVYTATHRALKKLLEADEVADARAEHAQRDAQCRERDGGHAAVGDAADGDPHRDGARPSDRRAVRDPEASSEGEA